MSTFSKVLAMSALVCTCRISGLCALASNIEPHIHAASQADTFVDTNDGVLGQLIYHMQHELNLVERRLLEVGHDDHEDDGSQQGEENHD